jgi:hypothetical protein
VIEKKYATDDNYKNYKCGDTTTLDDFKELTGGKNKNKNKDNNSTDYSKIVDSIFSFFLVLSIIIPFSSFFYFN